MYFNKKELDRVILLETLRVLIEQGRPKAPPSAEAGRAAGLGGKTYPGGWPAGRVGPTQVLPGTGMEIASIDDLIAAGYDPGIARQIYFDQAQQLDWIKEVQRTGKSLGPTEGPFGPHRTGPDDWKDINPSAGRPGPEPKWKKGRGGAMTAAGAEGGAPVWWSNEPHMRGSRGWVNRFDPRGGKPLPRGNWQPWKAAANDIMAKHAYRHAGLELTEEGLRRLRAGEELTPDHFTRELTRQGAQAESHFSAERATATGQPKPPDTVTNRMAYAERNLEQVQRSGKYGPVRGPRAAPRSAAAREIIANSSKEIVDIAGVRYGPRRVGGYLASKGSSVLTNPALLALELGLTSGWAGAAAVGEIPAMQKMFPEWSESASKGIFNAYGELRDPEGAWYSPEGYDWKGVGWTGEPLETSGLMGGPRREHDPRGAPTIWNSQLMIAADHVEPELRGDARWRAIVNNIRLGHHPADGVDVGQITWDEYKRVMRDEDLTHFFREKRQPFTPMGAPARGLNPKDHRNVPLEDDSLGGYITSHLDPEQAGKRLTPGLELLYADMIQREKRWAQKAKSGEQLTAEDAYDRIPGWRDSSGAETAKARAFKRAFASASGTWDIDIQDEDPDFDPLKYATMDQVAKLYSSPDRKEGFPGIPLDSCATCHDVEGATDWDLESRWEEVGGLQSLQSGGHEDLPVEAFQGPAIAGWPGGADLSVEAPALEFPETPTPPPLPAEVEAETGVPVPSPEHPAPEELPEEYKEEAPEVVRKRKLRVNEHLTRSGNEILENLEKERWKLLAGIPKNQTRN